MSSGSFKYITKKIISPDTKTPTCQELVQKGVDQRSAKACMAEKLGEMKNPENLYDNAKELERKMIERAEARRAEAAQKASAVIVRRREETPDRVAALLDQLDDARTSGTSEKQTLQAELWEQVRPHVVPYILGNPILAGIIGSPATRDILNSDPVTTDSGEVVRLVIRRHDRQETREIRFRDVREQRGVRGIAFEISDPGGFRGPDDSGSLAFMDLDSFRK